MNGIRQVVGALKHLHLVNFTSKSWKIDKLVYRMHLFQLYLMPWQSGVLMLLWQLVLLLCGNLWWWKKAYQSASQVQIFHGLILILERKRLLWTFVSFILANLYVSISIQGCWFHLIQVESAVNIKYGRFTPPYCVNFWELKTVWYGMLLVMIPWNTKFLSKLWSKLKI